MSLEAAVCPRCRYDMVGAIEVPSDGTWRIEVRCSECGLEVPSRECFPKFTNTPPWLSFGIMIPGKPIRRFLSTFVRMLIPFLPWRSLRMSTGISTRGLLVWWAYSMLLIVVLSLITTGVLAWRIPWITWGAYLLWHQMGAETGMFVAKYPYVGLFPRPIGLAGGTLSSEFISTSLAWVSGALLFFSPLGMGYMILLLLLPVTRKRCNVHYDHLRHIAIFSTLPYALIVFVLPIAVLIGSFSRFAYESLLISCGVWVFWFTAFWYGVLRSYLQLPHAFWTVVLMFVFGVVFCLTTMSIIAVN